LGLHPNMFCDLHGYLDVLAIYDCRGCGTFRT
jgi:hypothetical protein